MIDFFAKNLSLFLLLIICSLYIITLKKNKLKSLKFFTFYLASVSIVMICSISLARNKLPNLYISHFYFIGQFIFLSLFYRSIFVNQIQKRLVYIILFVVISILGVQYYIQPYLFLKFNILEVFICSSPLVAYAIIHLYNSLTRRGVFIYINIGVLIYLTSSTLIFIFGDYLADFRDKNLIVKNIWLINKGLYISYLLLIFMEWYKNFRVYKQYINHSK